LFISVDPGAIDKEVLKWLSGDLKSILQTSKFKIQKNKSKEERQHLGYLDSSMNQ